jgi:hypothetical protein
LAQELRSAIKTRRPSSPLRDEAGSFVFGLVFPWENGDFPWGNHGKTMGKWDFWDFPAISPSKMVILNGKILNGMNQLITGLTWCFFLRQMIKHTQHFAGNMSNQNS